MSVLIKDMKMPENCIGCPMQHGGWCYVAPDEIDERVSPTVADAWAQGKPDWCPLVEVPTPHGRLINADYLKEHITACATNGRPLHTMELSELLEAIDDVPTVIEEEE